MVRTVIGGALVVEGLMSGLAVTQDLPTAFAARDVVTILIVVARGVVGVLLFAGGWMLVRRSPVASVIAPIALVASAVLRCFELGFALGPTDLQPALRWPVTIGYAVFAAVGIILLRIKRN